MTNKNHTQIHKHSTDWKDWEKSGENALNTARKLLECEQYNYTCYVGQEALELYVKALLIQHDSQIDVAEVGHSAGLYFFDATKEHTSSTSERNPGMWDIIHSMLTKHRGDIFSKMKNPESWNKIWLAQILAPSAMKNNDVLFYKSPGQTKSKIRRAEDEVMKQCDPQQAELVKKATKGRSLKDFLPRDAFKVLMLYKDTLNVDDKAFKRLVPLLALANHLNALLLAMVHQQCTRYPTIVDGQAVKFSKDEINMLGIEDVNYKSKRSVTTVSYTPAMARNILDKFEAVIADIKYYLHYTGK